MAQGVLGVSGITRHRFDEFSRCAKCLAKFPNEAIKFAGCSVKEQHLVKLVDDAQAMLAGARSDFRCNELIVDRRNNVPFEFEGTPYRSAHAAAIAIAEVFFHSLYMRFDFAAMDPLVDPNRRWERVFQGFADSTTLKQSERDATRLTVGIEMERAKISVELDNATLAESDRWVEAQCGAAGPTVVPVVPSAPQAGLPAAKPAKAGRTKKSTQRGDGRAIVQAVVTKWHEYDSGHCANTHPILSNEAARRAGVAKDTASRFFQWAFGGHDKYMAICLGGSIGFQLQRLNGEISPAKEHALYEEATAAAVRATKTDEEEN